MPLHPRSKAGEVADFEAVWSRRSAVDLMPGVQANLPSIDDLILTKRFALRPKDVEDIRLLETVRGRA